MCSDVVGHKTAVVFVLFFTLHYRENFIDIYHECIITSVFSWKSRMYNCLVKILSLKKSNGNNDTDSEQECAAQPNALQLLETADTFSDLLCHC